MAKPAGPACNLRCGYCYYLDKAALFPPAPGAWRTTFCGGTSPSACGRSPGPTTHFEWHGGEPTLLGLDFFRDGRPPAEGVLPARAAR